MSPALLKKGLTAYKERVKKQKDDLTQLLKKGEKKNMVDMEDFLQMPEEQIRWKDDTSAVDIQCVAFKMGTLRLCFNPTFGLLRGSCSHSAVDIQCVAFKMGTLRLCFNPTFGLLRGSCSHSDPAQARVQQGPLLAHLQIVTPDIRVTTGGASSELRAPCKTSVEALACNFWLGLGGARSRKLRAPCTPYLCDNSGSQTAWILARPLQLLVTCEDCSRSSARPRSVAFPAGELRRRLQTRSLNGGTIARNYPHEDFGRRQPPTRSSARVLMCFIPTSLGALPCTTARLEPWGVFLAPVPRLPLLHSGDAPLCFPRTRLLTPLHSCCCVALRSQDYELRAAHGSAAFGGDPAHLSFVIRAFRASFRRDHTAIESKTV
ncbi:hypothetical protein DFH09DRAFT_1087856 [Mycena vulgaris]|nr:hypothetical protein DFH09DRAFT_1087856 [Mycena vulgaris]